MLYLPHALILVIRGSVIGIICGSDIRETISTGCLNLLLNACVGKQKFSAMCAEVIK